MLEAFFFVIMLSLTRALNLRVPLCPRNGSRSHQCVRAMASKQVGSAPSRGEQEMTVVLTPVQFSYR